MSGNSHPCDGMSLEYKAHYIAAALCPSNQLNNKRYKAIQSRALIVLQHTYQEAADRVTGCEQAH